MKVFIGVDPHKPSATIKVVDGHESVVITGRFTTDAAGYGEMRKHAGGGSRRWSRRPARA